ncbi:MAG: FAD-dependent oxidoreductase [Rhodospirillales bacterium]|jgi:glycine/D-amino acid oxidase-like deaminating enzyme|nr:FAD-dependent oxidoreductase [Rhodospirillales bacterium]MDP6882907.1 FAD-dependent oxidoreductase [Rhodospirillales bacterium]
MRIEASKIVPVAPKVAITFDGEVLSGYEGESLAACLTAAGKLTLRRARSGRARGLFCGMGVCSDCLVTVNGRQNQRACMTPLGPEMIVETQSQPGTDPSDDPPYSIPEGETTEHPVEVLVVGAGPAGLQAARAAAAAGARVVIVDERPAPGGQYYKQLSQTHAFSDQAAMDNQFRAGRDLIAEVEGLGVRILRQALVWGAFAADEIGVVADGEAMIFRPRQLILATGAYEKGVPLPGWTLPGYMTTGAVQTLVRAYRVAPGRRVLVAGNGPLNFQVASELVDSGVEVVALVEAARRPGPGQVPAALRAFRHAPDLMRDGLKYLARLGRAGVPVLYGHVVVEARGSDAVETAVVAPIGLTGEAAAEGRREFAVDAVSVGYGFMPSNDISRPLGCRHHYDADRDSLVVELSADCETSVAGVFVAGDCGVMGGSRVAMEQGFIAGCKAAGNLGKALPDPVIAERDRRRRRLASHQRFQKAIWTVFRAPALTDQLARDDTLVCRCEEVTLATLRRTAEGDSESVGNLKHQTRAGMGPCQGRYCGALMARMIDRRVGSATGEFSFFAPRPPIKPVPVGVIARPQADLRGLVNKAEPLDGPVGRPATATGESLETDVLIIGGGVLGCATAYYLAREGVETILVEKNDINANASGRNAGTLHAQLQQAQARHPDPAWGKSFDDALPLYLEAGQTWKALSEELDCDIELKFIGGLMVGETQDDIEFLENKVRRERARGLESVFLSTAELRDFAPYLSPHILGAEFCPHEGKLNPIRATPALARGAKAAGARIVRHTEIHDLEAADKGFVAATSRGPIRCKRVVNAAGPWAAHIAAMVGVSFPIVPSPIQSVATQAAAPLVRHMLLHAHRRLSMKQTTNGNVIIGGGWPALWEKGMDQPQIARASIEGNLWVAASVVPALRQLKLLRSWTGINLLVDGKPLLGEVPKRPGFFNAVTSTGYTLGAVSGRLIAEQMTGRNLSYDITPFSIERFDYM